ncbi:hypothetical protein CMESO_151 (nucleomorph) [Chroomonas mesostigmatica CCMP1168]|uniref:Uncharacterized protein n=1 Tax=Chroomonas mesostigmatica CCMP1168 TaxID=1195612 RepID=J7G2T4_9CRYP|nr:hypothetical protein CMESO_151 [Chroomonas mesostigmatica CCMP1168]
MNNKINFSKKNNKNFFFHCSLFIIFNNIGVNRHFQKKILVSSIQAIFNFTVEYCQKNKCFEIFFYNFLKKKFIFGLQSFSIYFFFLTIVENSYIFHILFRKNKFNFLLNKKKILQVEFMKNDELFFKSILNRFFPIFFLESFLLEIEILYENSKKNIFFENYHIEKFLRVCCFFASFFSDQSLFEHYSSFIKGQIDFLGDIFGFFFLEKSTKKSELFFNDTFSEIYETFNLKNKTRLKLIKEKNIEAMPFIKEELRKHNPIPKIKNKFKTIERKIKFKLDISLSKRCYFYQKYFMVKNNERNKLECSYFSFLGDLFFKIPISKFSPLIALFIQFSMFRFLKKDSHFIIHNILSIFLFFLLERKNHEKIFKSKIINYFGVNFQETAFFCFLFFKKKSTANWIKLNKKHNEVLSKPFFFYFSYFYNSLKKPCDYIKIFFKNYFSKKILKLEFFIFIQNSSFNISSYYRNISFLGEKKKQRILFAFIKKKFFKIKNVQCYLFLSNSIYDFLVLNSQNLIFFLFSSFKSNFLLNFGKIYVTFLKQILFLVKILILLKVKINLNPNLFFSSLVCRLLSGKKIAFTHKDALFVKKFSKLIRFLRPKKFFLFLKLWNAIFFPFNKNETIFSKWRIVTKLHIRTLNKSQKKLSFISFLNCIKIRSSYILLIKKFQKLTMNSMNLLSNKILDCITKISCFFLPNHSSFFGKFLFCVSNSVEKILYETSDQNFISKIKTKNLKFIFN